MFEIFIFTVEITSMNLEITEKKNMQTIFQSAAELFCKVRVSFRWEVLDTFGGFLGATGLGEILELTPDLVSPKVLVKSSGGGSSQAKAAGHVPQVSYWATL